MASLRVGLIAALAAGCSGGKDRPAPPVEAAPAAQTAAAHVAAPVAL